MIEFLLGLVIGITAGGMIVINYYDEFFDGKFDKVKYEYKLNKEKQNDTTKN